LTQRLRCLSIRCIRITLDIEEDVLQAAKEIAAKEKTTAGVVISRLARSSLMGPSPADTDDLLLRNGVPVITGTGHPITLKHVQAIMDEAGI